MLRNGPWMATFMRNDILKSPVIIKSLCSSFLSSWRELSMEDDNNKKEEEKKVIIKKLNIFYAFVLSCLPQSAGTFAQHANKWLLRLTKSQILLVIWVKSPVRLVKRHWPCLRGFKVFKVLLNFWPLGARKRSYIRTRHSLWTSTWVLLINNYHTLYKKVNKCSNTNQSCYKYVRLRRKD